MCNHHNHKNNSSKDHKLRHGAALEHGKAHSKDHKKWSRRNFLSKLGVAGGSMMLAKMPLTSLAASPLGYMLNAGVSDRVIVLIRLNGGNDGLNTFIPLDQYGTYAANRPQIAIPESQVINLSAETGMHNNMADLMPLWNEGKMKVVNSVGYDNPNLSHFRSTDIWHSASDSNVVDTSGWLGRFLENEYPDYLTNPPEDPPAIQIGSPGSILFNGMGENNPNFGVTTNNPEQLAEIAATGQLYDIENLDDCYYGDQLAYLRAVANSTFRYAEGIKIAFDNASTEADYPNTLGEQLSLVARLIKGGLTTKFYMVTLGGFDTHAGQLNNHAQLLDNLSKSVSAFYEDLAAGGKDKDVLSMTYSEFGRRVQQNASDGTDHGTAAPVMIFGEGLNGNGIVGNNPNLSDLNPDGNLKYGTDFREIYATLLENWLCIEPALVDNILGQTFDRIDELGLICDSTVSSPSLPGYQIEHEARYAKDGTISIHYTLPNTMYVKVEIFNMLGQPMKVLFNGRQSGGQHQLSFTGTNRYAAAQYIYRIEANGQAYSRQLVLMK